jgi:hypothetical protein
LEEAEQTAEETMEAAAEAAEQGEDDIINTVEDFASTVGEGGEAVVDYFSSFFD